MKIDEIVNELLIAGISDWVMLDEVTWAVMEGNLSEENRLATVHVLELLYSAGLMVPGDLSEGRFVDWIGAPAEWVDRSQRELERLQWKPMGAGFYLRLTDMGDMEALRLSGMSGS